MTEEKTITIKESELRALIEQVQAQTNQKTDVEETGKTRRRVRERNVTIMFVDGKAVIGMVNHGTEDEPRKLYEHPDPNDSTRRVLYADLIIKDPATGKTETIKRVNWLEFLREGARQECRVIKTRNEEWIIDQGTVLKKEVKEYRTVELDTEVPVDIEGTTRHYIVDIDGKGLEVHEDYVNMASATKVARREIVRDTEQELS